VTVNDVEITSRSEPEIPAGGLGPGDAPTNLIVFSTDLIFDEGNSMTVRRRLQEDKPPTPYEICLEGKSRTDTARCCVNVTLA